MRGNPQDPGGLTGLLASHAWLGLVGSWVLFAVFFTGALTMFKREIDLWEKAPAYLGSDARTSLTLDAVLAATVVPPEVRDAHIEVLLPGPTSAYYQVFVYDDDGDYYRADGFHPHTGALLPAPELTGFGEFLEEFHKELYLPLGHYLVGAVTLLFFLGLVTGLVLYWPKFTWASLKTIRWSRPRLRWLDLHNTTGVVGLPFHLLMAFTGVVFNLAIVFNAAVVMGRLGGDASAVRELRFAPPLPVAAAGQAQVTRGTDVLIADAARRLDADPLRVSLHHYGDRNALFTVHVHGRGSFAQVGQITYRVDDGSVVRELPPQNINAFAHGNEVLHRLHYGDFGGLWLRALYFTLAMASCLLIATGNLLWIEKRLAQRRPPRGIGLVAALSVGTCGGTLLAVAVAMMFARLLPVDMATRMDVVIGAFAVVLVACNLFGGFAGQPRRVLIALCVAAGALFALLPVLDWLRFGPALIRAVAGGDYAVPVVEAMCIAFAVSLLVCARWLARDVLRGATLRFARER
jgi:uncharacterized iron-regulated membrane protein